MWRKGNPHTLLMEMQVSSASTENITEPPQKTKTTTGWSSNSILSIYPKTPIKKKTIIQKVICTPMFIAVLCRIAKIWQQPKYPSTNKQIKKMRHIYRMEYYSAIKKRNLATCDNMDGFWDSIWSHFYVKSENKTKDKICEARESVSLSVVSNSLGPHRL